MSEMDLEVDEEGAAEPTEESLNPRILPNVTHNASGWRQGCRCNVCRADHRLKLREHRKAKREQKREDREKAQADAEKRAKLFPTMTAVAAQLDALDAMEANPGIAAVALKMAAILDDSAATPQQPAAAGKLLDALEKLGVRPREASTKLASVRNMVNRPLHAVQDA